MRWWLVLLVACETAPQPPAPAPAPAYAPVAPVAIDAAVADARVPPPGCMARDDLEWTCPEVVLATDGPRAIVCFREDCDACVEIEPRTGKVVGPATLPSPTRPEDAPPPSGFEAFAEDRTIAVCKSGACKRVPNALPPGTHDLMGVAVNATGTELFVLQDDVGVAYDVGSHRRIGRVKLALPPDQPPPPGSATDAAYWGRGVLLGDFNDIGAYDRAIDPTGGHWMWLDKPWARIGKHLLVHFGGMGKVELYDFDAHLALVASRKAGQPRNPGEGVSGFILRAGDDALVVTQVPPATLFVDAKARTISKPRPLPCH